MRWNLLVVVSKFLKYTMPAGRYGPQLYFTMDLRFGSSHAQPDAVQSKRK